ncbi:MAG: ATPase involved in replication control Cdc46/Mcm family [Candidatus Methanohalarchaeum thermophilum]|uniref:ATPase involved in replication control Cdc46/Mcm family n=1 Tax=Methanohalarchaeum thermophilum TaxID=1903181 RepID=A0A1Q6DTV6_METT1|nr:MAG: ATPase involved in replication control Cdc46/Mcm family [Candidatus Methanohalarchaeum thermophilum]
MKFSNWKCKKCGEVINVEGSWDRPEECPKCGGTEFELIGKEEIDDYSGAGMTDITGT